MWTIPDGRVVGQVLRHQDEVYHAQFSPDGRRVVTASKDKTAQVWHASTGQRWGEAIRHDDAVVYAGFSPDEHTIITLAGNTAFLRSSLPGQAFSEPLQHDARINSARFSPDSQLVVTASQDGTARVWDAMTGHPVSEPMRHDDAVTYAEFSRDGRWIVTAGKDGKVRVWEALRADLPVPVWLPELADGFAGRRFNALDASVPVPVERLFQLRQALMLSSATGPLTDWAKWLFNVETNRTMSVSSPVTHTEYLQRLTNQNHP